MINDKFILKHRKPVPCNDLLKWSHWYEKKQRRVRSTYIGPYWISTVFLGLNHRFFGDGPPILFETMVFNKLNPGEDLYSGRTCTWRHALKMHWHAVAIYKRRQKMNLVPRGFNTRRIYRAHDNTSEETER